MAMVGHPHCLIAHPHNIGKLQDPVAEMSVERGGGGGLLKTRTESFARHLQCRLRSLSDVEVSDPWQEPSPSSDTEYYSIDSSLASPEEEAAEPIYLSVQRSDSGSQYFDTVESFEQSPPPSPSPSLKQIPVLHLKTARPPLSTNGHTKLLDDDSGCSRVLEIPCLEINFIENESANYVDNSIIVNNKEIIGIVNESPEHCETCNGDVGQINGFENDVLQIVQIDQEPKPANSFCVFCDIEEFKSSLSGKTAEDLPSNSEHKASNNEVEVKQENLLHVKATVEENNNSEISDNEETVPLSELLQVLKQEISREQEQQIQTKPDPTIVEKHEDTSLTCPVVQVQESPPDSSEETGKPVEDEEFDIETKRKSFRRCSSLKTGKTPPGTPGRKKIVRFADVLGLDLANVKTYLDEVPTIPKSAYEDLHGIDLSTPDSLESPFNRVMIITPQVDKVLLPLFQQPCMQPNFLDRVRENNVCLESAYVSDMTLFAISGLVRVKNMDFHKSVYVRYSINKWKTFSELQARYVQNSCDGFSDKFTFMLYAHNLSVGDHLEFAVRYHCSGAQYWDSNAGINYKFECTSRGLPRTYMDSPSILQSPFESWASFY